MWGFSSWKSWGFHGAKSGKWKSGRDCDDDRGAGSKFGWEKAGKAWGFKHHRDDDGGGKHFRWNRDDDDHRGWKKDGDDHRGWKKGCKRKDDADDAPPPVEDEVCTAENIVFIGTDENETINGACANDELYGARGDDEIFGGDGFDYLSGNQGADMLTGGADADTFSFDGDFDQDTVTDFSIEEGDRIEFIFYKPEEADYTAEDMSALFMQEGDDAVLKLPGVDEVVVIEDTAAADITADLISIRFVASEDDLIA